MIVHVGSFLDNASYVLDNYNIYEVNGVKSIELYHKCFDKSMYPFGWIAKTNDIIEPSDNIYFYIDTLFHHAFAHWVFESAIYLPLFKILKDKYPNIKIYSKEIKSYKKILCRAFDIDDTDITSVFIENSRVLFPTYQSFHIFLPHYTDSNDTVIDPKYKMYLNNFYNYFKKDNIIKDIDILYLPRGNKENFCGNDRVILIQDVLIEYISNLPNSMILNTDTMTNFNEQVDILRRSKIIVLDYGSSLNVNAFFAENSNIIVLNYDIHHEIQQILNHIYNLSQARNKIVFIKNSSTEGSNPIKVNIDISKVKYIIQKNLEEISLHNQENLS